MTESAVRLWLEVVSVLIVVPFLAAVQLARGEVRQRRVDEVREEERDGVRWSAWGDWTTRDVIDGLLFVLVAGACGVGLAVLFYLVGVRG